MKTNFTRDLAWKKSVLFILFAILFLLSLSKVAFTQPDNKPDLHSTISGIDLIMNFKGVRKEGQVHLQWQLTSTKDVSTIIIEKARRGTEFNAIGEIWVDGSTITKNFKFKDNLNYASGKINYRLKLLTTSGRIEYSPQLDFNN